VSHFGIGHTTNGNVVTPPLTYCPLLSLGQTRVNTNLNNKTAWQQEQKNTVKPTLNLLICPEKFDMQQNEN